MECVITLAGPVPLEDATIEALAGSVDATRTVRRARRAADVYAMGEPSAIRAAAASSADRLGVDAIVQPAARRARRLLVCDMDSTMIEQECIDELAAVTGLKEKVAEITARAMDGEIDFAGALRERVALLAGTPAAAIERLLAEVITPSPGAPELITACRAAGVRTVLVSGGFLQFARPVAVRLGFDAVFANDLDVAAGTLTGRVAEPILGADAKRERLRAECDALGIALGEAVALGDGANDAAMVEAAGLGIGYRAKPSLQAVADATLHRADLTAVAHALGLEVAEAGPAVWPASLHDAEAHQ